LLGRGGPPRFRLFPVVSSSTPNAKSLFLKLPTDARQNRENGLLVKFLNVVSWEREKHLISISSCPRIPEVANGTGSILSLHVLPIGVRAEYLFNFVRREVENGLQIVR
jgi:hypothetical protein